MGPAIIALCTAVVAGLFAAFVSEMYKRHRDMTATAAAIAGELSSYREAYQQLDLSIDLLIKMVERGEQLNLPPQDSVPDVAYEAYIDKVGLLGSQIAEDVTYVYGQIRGFRSSFFALTKQSGPVDPIYTVTVLRICHQFMKKANGRSEPLIVALQNKAKEPFWLALRRTMRELKSEWTAES